jgi:glycosyltransferase involved in cell wall biosynthesis
MTSEINSRPWITVVIATYNSSRFLPKLAKMLDEQICPAAAGPMEILAVDGGSTDGSRSVAESLGFTVIDNPEGHAIAAKHIGLTHASSKLICYLDHDELLIRSDSLLRRYQLFAKYPEVRAIISSGYYFNHGDKASNMYASEFGDPVSLLTYRSPNHHGHRAKFLQKTMNVVIKTDELMIVKAGSESRPILCEMAAGSGTIDSDFFRTTFGKEIEDANVIPHLYYLLGQSSRSDQLGLLLDDPVSHASVEDWKTVRAKIRWRTNNAVNNTDISQSGFSGRQYSAHYKPWMATVKFVLYCASLIWPVIDAVRYAVTRRRIGYLNHLFLTYFVLLQGVYLKVQGLVKGSSTNQRYDGS